jgi:hypothetical protein
LKCVENPLALPTKLLDDAPKDPTIVPGAASKAQISTQQGAATAHATSTSATGDSFVPWSGRTAEILSKYTTNERIGVSANFIDGGQVCWRCRVCLIS